MFKFTILTLNSGIHERKAWDKNWPCLSAEIWALRETLSGAPES